MLKNLGFFICVFYGSTVALNYCPTPETSPAITANLTCDETLTVFADGQQIGLESQGFDKVEKYIIPANARVVALQCHSGIKLSLVTGGIIGSLSNGMITSSLWRCTNSAKQGWSEDNFDDSSWPMARVHGTNVPGEKSWPWGVMRNVSARAHWIWTVNNKLNGSTVYCRIRLKNDTANHCVIERKADLFHGGASFINRSLNGSVVMTITTASPTQCALRCQRVPLCASFNFQYGGKETQKLCELNSMSINDPHGLVVRHGFMYFNYVIH